MENKIILETENRYTQIKNATPEQIKEINNKLSYKVAGRKYSEAYLKGKWSGRQYLMRFSKKQGYSFPSGLLHVVKKKLDQMKLDFLVNDLKQRNNPKPEIYNWNKSIKLRDYQKQAVKSIIDNQGCGILKMCIRSGKTKTAAAIIWTLKARSIFVVPSQLLLYQTQESLSESLGERVGVIGDGEWQEERVSVATIQTLLLARNNKDPKYARIIKNYDLAIFDESHHFADTQWSKVFLEFDCPHKIGLSATVFLNLDKEKERGIMWLTAACGQITYRLEMSELIEMGHLLAPEVRLYRIMHPDNLKKRPWDQELLQEGIYENEYRNTKICNLAIELAAQKHRVLIVTNRTSQIDALESILAQSGVKPYILVGKTSKKNRIKGMKEFTKTGGQIMIATIISEGVDLPSVEVLINADGGSDIKSTIQKLRNLTPASGKEKAIVVDFIDLTNKYFAAHSKNRLSVYRGESLFNIRIMEEQ